MMAAGLAGALAALALGTAPAASPPPISIREANILFEKALEAEPAEGRKLLERASASGDPDILNAYAVFLEGGVGGAADPEAARTLMERAAAAGSRAAKVNLGDRLIDSPDEAERRRAATMLLEVFEDRSFKGRALAAPSLGRAFVFGLGVETDARRGIDVLEAPGVAQLKNAGVEYLLGRTYQNGWGGRPVKPETAFAHFRTSAELGNPGAAWYVGMALLRGEGVARNDREAYSWVRRSAEGGHARGQISTAVMLATGEGVAEDDVEARVWYHKAAEQNSAHALRGLGSMLVTGEGGAADVATGVAYLELAAAHGDGNAPKILQSLEGELSSAARADVERIKAEWLTAHGAPHLDQ